MSRVSDIYIYIYMLNQVPRSIVVERGGKKRRGAARKGFKLGIRFEFQRAPYGFLSVRWDKDEGKIYLRDSKTHAAPR